MFISAPEIFIYYEKVNETGARKWSRFMAPRLFLQRVSWITKGLSTLATTEWSKKSGTPVLIMR